MFRICTKLLLPVLFTFVITACEPENFETSSLPPTSFKENLYATGKKRSLGTQHLKSDEDNPVFENLQDVVLNAVIPSECGATEFSRVSGHYFEKLMKDPEALEYLEHYKYLNRQAAKIGLGSDYYGSNGNHTSLVQKRHRDLSRFWLLSKEIQVLGQHNITLMDRENLADIYWYSIQDMESREEAYQLADKILELNQKYPELINSPFVASDGFASRNHKIMIGDGLIQLFAETGLSYEIVWTGILTHEWAHQVQFEYWNSWYPGGISEDPAERTRNLELEADFFSGYYMTHKRGATYNWKRAEEFFELFYQAGDCSFEFEQHHGTPLQRKQASYEGYLLAKEAKKKGHILPAETLHEYFQEIVLPKIVEQLEYL